METYSIPEGMDTVTLPLDDGTDLVCDVVMMFTVDDQEYIALLPPDGYDEEGTVYLMKNGKKLLMRMMRFLTVKNSKRIWNLMNY